MVEVEDKMVAELGPLAKVINELDPAVRAKLIPVFNNLDLNLRNRREKLGLIRSALSQLSLDLKYMLFDLDATRSERDEFKNLWENR